MWRANPWVVRGPVIVPQSFYAMTATLLSDFLSQADGLAGRAGVLRCLTKSCSDTFPEKGTRLDLVPAVLEVPYYAKITFPPFSLHSSEANAPPPLGGVFVFFFFQTQIWFFPTPWGGFKNPIGLLFFKHFYKKGSPPAHFGPPLDLFKRV